MKKTKFRFPSIVEVSQTKNFIDDPYMKHKRKQICIGKLGGKFMCIQCKEENLSWMLNQIKHSISSGAISGLILEYWNYARKIETS